MSAAVVFLIFVICLVIAIPVSIALSIGAVLPGAFDPSFAASGTYVIRSMLGGLDSFPLLAVPMFVLSGIVMARGGISKRLFDVFVYFHLFVLWRYLRVCAGNGSSSGEHDDSNPC